MTVNINDIKAGDIVFVEDDSKVRLIVPVLDKLAVIGKSAWMPLETHLDEIEVVYRPKNNAAASKIFEDEDREYYDDCANAIWGDYDVIYTKNDDVKEVTLEQIAEKFNVDVSKIRIKE